MSVSSIGSSFSTPSLSTLLGSSSPAGAATSPTSASSDAVTVDLSAIAKAASSGDASSKDAAVKQLKSDLASEQTALLSSLVSSGFSADDATDTGNQLLSKLFGSSTLAAQTSSTTGTTINTTA